MQWHWNKNDTNFDILKEHYPNSYKAPKGRETRGKEGVREMYKRNKVHNMQILGNSWNKISLE